MVALELVDYVSVNLSGALLSSQGTRVKKGAHIASVARSAMVGRELGRAHCDRDVRPQPRGNSDLEPGVIESLAAGVALEGLPLQEA